MIADILQPDAPSYMSVFTPSADLAAPIVRHATRTGFFIAGFGLAVWAPLVPYVRERIEMSDALFGMLLLCIGIGSLTWMPLSGLLIARQGIRPVILGCVATLVLALLGMALTESIWLLGIALFCFGGSLGVLDVVLNVQSLLVERELGRRMMSNFHGMFSLGSICGALVLTGLLTLGLSPASGTLLMIALIVIANFLVMGGYLARKAPAGGVAFVRPSGLVLLVGALCFVVYLAEGAVLDWSALYLTGEKQLETSSGGLGYAAFALMVTVGQLRWRSGGEQPRHCPRRRLRRSAGGGRYWPVHHHRPLGAGIAGLWPVRAGLRQRLARADFLPQPAGCDAGAPGRDGRHHGGLRRGTRGAGDDRTDRPLQFPDHGLRAAGTASGQSGYRQPPVRRLNAMALAVNSP